MRCPKNQNGTSNRGVNESDAGVKVLKMGPPLGVFSSKIIPNLPSLSSGQISIIPKPELRGLWGSSLIKPPFQVTSAEVVIICPDVFFWKFPHPKLTHPYYGPRSPASPRIRHPKFISQFSTKGMLDRLPSGVQTQDPVNTVVGWGGKSTKKKQPPVRRLKKTMKKTSTLIGVKPKKQ